MSPIKKLNDQTLSEARRRRAEGENIKTIAADYVVTWQKLDKATRNGLSRSSRTPLAESFEMLCIQIKKLCERKSIKWKRQNAELFFKLVLPAIAVARDEWWIAQVIRGATRGAGSASDGEKWARVLHCLTTDLGVQATVDLFTRFWSEQIPTEDLQLAAQHAELLRKRGVL